MLSKQALPTWSTWHLVQLPAASPSHQLLTVALRSSCPVIWRGSRTQRWLADDDAERRWQHAARGHERGSTCAPDSGDEQPLPSSAAPSASGSAVAGPHSQQPPGEITEQAPTSARARACADLERMWAGPCAAAGTGHAGSVVEARAPQEQADRGSCCDGAPGVAGTANAWPPSAEAREAQGNGCRVSSRAPVAGVAHAGPGGPDPLHERGACGSAGAGLAPGERTADGPKLPADRHSNPHPNPEWLSERATVDTGAAETVDTGVAEAVDTGAAETVDSGKAETGDAGAVEAVCRVLRECSLVAAMHPDQVRRCTVREQAACA